MEVGCDVQVVSVGTIEGAAWMMWRKRHKGVARNFIAWAASKHLGINKKIAA
jgi:hypothetical protein